MIAIVAVFIIIISLLCLEKLSSSLLASLMIIIQYVILAADGQCLILRQHFV